MHSVSNVPAHISSQIARFVAEDSNHRHSIGVVAFFFEKKVVGQCQSAQVDHHRVA